MKKLIYASNLPTSQEGHFIDTIDDIVESTDDIGTHLSWDRELVREDDDITFILYFGMNGTGLWSNYFSTLADFTRRLESSVEDCYVTGVQVDVLDDAVTVNMRVSPYVSYGPEA